MAVKKVSVIVSVYKNVKALNIILNSLQNQSRVPDEIIISEDGDSKEMKEYISKLNDKKIIHLTQEDLGWRKNRALNNSIIKATSDYLIFIDGDVVPHKRFVENHLKCAEPKFVCVGKRCELGEEYSEKVYENELSIDEIASSYIRKIISLHKDSVHHYEDGIFSPLLNKITSSRHIRHIIGCNFSCYKTDMLVINGFNEDFILPSEGEDVDITWRFRENEIEMKSCRYIANVYHLWHKKGFGNDEGEVNRAIMRTTQENNESICLNGIKKLKAGENI